MKKIFIFLNLIACCFLLTSATKKHKSNYLFFSQLHEQFDRREEYKEFHGTCLFPLDIKPSETGGDFAIFVFPKKPTKVFWGWMYPIEKNEWELRTIDTLQGEEKLLAKLKKTNIEEKDCY